MKFKVKAYDINELTSSCLPDSNKENIIFQLENREIWLLHDTYKHNDIITVTDPATIRYLKKLYVNELEILEETN
jgi:hypothetical protein